MECQRLRWAAYPIGRAFPAGRCITVTCLEDAASTGPMITLRHVAQAVGAGGTNVPAYRVEILVGAHRLVGDEPLAEGGADVGPSPFGFLLSGLVACTVTTLRMCATRKGWEFSDITVDVRYDVDEWKGID